MTQPPKRSTTHEEKYKKYANEKRKEKNKERKKNKYEKHLLKLKKRREVKNV